MSCGQRDELKNLPPFMLLNLKHAREDIDAKANNPLVEKVLAFELFMLRRMFEDADREQSMGLAKEALSYAQDVLHKAGRLPPLKIGRDSRVR